MAMLHQKVAPCWGWVKRKGGRRGNWGSKRMLALQFVAAPWQVIVIVSQSAPRLTDCPTKCHAVIAPRAKSQFQLDAACCCSCNSGNFVLGYCVYLSLGCCCAVCLECIAVAPELCLVEHSKLHRESQPPPPHCSLPWGPCNPHHVAAAQCTLLIICLVFVIPCSSVQLGQLERNLKERKNFKKELHIQIYRVTYSLKHTLCKPSFLLINWVRAPRIEQSIKRSFILSVLLYDFL